MKTFFNTAKHCMKFLIVLISAQTLAVYENSTSTPSSFLNVQYAYLHSLQTRAEYMQRTLDSRVQTLLAENILAAAQAGHTLSPSAVFQLHASHTCQQIYEYQLLLNEITNTWLLIMSMQTTLP